MNTIQLLRGILICIVLLFNSCQFKNTSHPILERAEQLMDAHPDSALVLLQDSVHPADLSEKNYADWCLLLTQATDKCYEPHTSDSLIRIACEYYEEHTNPERLMLSYYYMGRVCQSLGNARYAQHYYLEALNIGQDENNYTLKARIHSNMGMLYTYQRSYDAALPHLKSALDYLQLLEDTASQSFVLRDIGRTYHKLELLDSAEYYYRQALVYASPQNIASISNELGGILLDRQAYDTALVYIQDALSKIYYDNQRTPIYYALGTLYFHKNQLDSASYYLQKGLESPEIRTRLGSYYYLYQVAKQQEDYKAYATLQEQYDLVKDSVELLTYREDIQRQQALYNVQQIEKEAEKYKKMHGSNSQKLFLFGCGLMFLGCILTFFVLYYRYKKKKWEKELADVHAKMQINTAMEDQQKEDRENTLRGSAIYRKFHQYGKNAQGEFGMKCSWAPSPEDWEELIIAIDTAYPNFAGNIRKYFIKMDKNDEYFLYLVKSRIKSATIAKLLCLSESAISLRKKRNCIDILGETGSAKKFELFIESL